MMPVFPSCVTTMFNRETKFAEKLTLVKTLVYYDFPLIQHYQDEREQDYIMLFADDQSPLAVWYMIPVNKHQLELVLSEDITMALSLNSLMRQINVVYYMEDRHLDFSKNTGRRMTSVLPEHMPAEGSFISQAVFEEWYKKNG